MHKLLLDYISYASKEQRTEMLLTLKEFLPEICHTREGALVGMECVWTAEAKDRKVGLGVREASEFTALFFGYNLGL